MSGAVGDMGRLRQEIADACRVLAARGLAEGYLGHISLRVDENRLLVRCRGPQGRGLAWTTAEDVRLVTVDGMPGAPGELAAWSADRAAAAHGGASPPDGRGRRRARPSAGGRGRRPGGCGHPPAHRGVRHAGDEAGCRRRPGVPEGVLVRDERLAGEMVAAVGERPVVVLRGHGLTSTGAGVAEAELPDLGGGFTVDTAWRHELARLR